MGRFDLAAARRLLIAVAVAAMLVAVGFAYSPARTGAFVWDDHALAQSDARFRHATARELMTQSFWPEGSLSDARGAYYRPLVLFSLRGDMALGDKASDFHETNLLLHLLACALVAAVAARLGATAGAAIVAALLWGLAPRLTESVAWISGRTDVLACIFGLAFLVFAPETSARRANKNALVRWLCSIVAGLSLFLALGSKEVAVAFVAALLVAAVSVDRRESESESRRHQALRVGVYVVAPLAVYFGLRSIALAGRTLALRDLGGARRIATALEATARYAEMTLDATRPRTSIGMVGEVDGARAALGAALVLAFVAGAVFLVRRMPAGARTGLALAFAAIATVLHLVPLALAGSVAADRLLYVPLAGLAIGLAVWARQLGRRATLAAGVAAFGLAIVFAAATTARSKDYGDETRFWVVAAEGSHPHNTMARRALASRVRDDGDAALACRLFERSDEVQSTTEAAGLAAHRRTRENLVSCWARIGRYDDALRLAEELVRIYPDAGRVHMGLAFVRLATRDFDGAASAFARALALDKGLDRTIQPVLRDLAKARLEWDRFKDVDARVADRLGWAKHLGRIGRAKDADQAYLVVVVEPSDDPGPRSAAFDYLTLDGGLEAAEQALIARPDLLSQLTSRRFRMRRVRRSVLAALRPRIEALAR